MEKTHLYAPKFVLKRTGALSLGTTLPLLQKANFGVRFFLRCDFNTGEYGSFRWKSEQDQGKATKATGSTVVEFADWICGAEVVDPGANPGGGGDSALVSQKTTILPSENAPQAFRFAVFKVELGLLFSRSPLKRAGSPTSVDPLLVPCS